MASDLLLIKNVDKRFNGIKALDNFSCSVRKGEILGLIGPNGAGKTTLLNIINGFITPERGEIIFHGKKLIGEPVHRIACAGIARSFQNLRLIKQISVLGNILLSSRNQPGEKLLNVFFKREICWNHEKELIEKALLILNYVGLSAKANEQAGSLSYGQQKLLSLACSLFAESDLMLLDEPVAGIAPELIQKISTIISTQSNKGKSVILIEHNLDIVMQLCDRIIFMDLGVKISEGIPMEVRNDPRVIEAYID